MFNNKSLALAGMMAVLASSASAGETQFIMTVTSNAEAGKIGKIEVATDEQGDLTGMIVSDNTGKPPKSFSLPELVQGAVLNHNKKHNIDIVILRSQGGFNAKDGGLLLVDYVVHGFWKTHGSYELEFVRNGANWEARTVGNHENRAPHSLIRAMDMQGNWSRLLRMFVGIGYVSTEQ